MFALALVTAIAILLNVVSGAVLTNTLSLDPADAAATSLGPIFSVLGHRHVSEGAGTLVVVLAVWITIAGKIGRAKIIGWIAVALVGVETVVGRTGAPLTPLLGFLHAILAEGLFALVVSIVVYTWPGWTREPVLIPDKGWPSLRGLSTTLVVVLLMQVTLGAAFRHNLLSVLWHILGAFLVVVIGLATIVIITQVPENRSMRPPVIWLGVLLGVQVTLGMVLISISDPAKHRAVTVSTVALHHLIGTMAMGLGVMIAMLIRRSVRAPVAAAAS